MSYLGEWSKREADIATKCVSEMFDAIPKSKRLEFIGHFNEALIFIGKAKKEAPEITEKEK